MDAQGRWYVCFEALITQIGSGLQTIENKQSWGHNEGFKTRILVMESMYIYMINVYEAVSDQGPVWVQSEDKIPRASKSNFEVEILISLVSLLP